MAIMFGNGRVKTVGEKKLIMKTETFTANSTTFPTFSGAEGSEKADSAVSGWSNKFESPDGKFYDKINPKFFDETGKSVDKNFVADTKYFCTYDLAIDGSVIDISANSFPGTYYITGDTFARSEASGKDEFFQFIIPKAKVTSENTITLEAEGDPSVFNLNLRVMRPADGKMMRLVKYNLAGEGEAVGAETSAVLIHNHNLGGKTDTDGSVVTLGG